MKILAGAGAGKTTEIVRRVVEAVDGGVRPSRIGIVTYTSAATANLVDRLHDQDVSGVKVGTIHDLARRRITRERSSLTFATSAGEDLDVWAEAAASCGLSWSQNQCGQVAGLVSDFVARRFIAEQWVPFEGRRLPTGVLPEQISTVIPVFQRLMRAYGLVSFDDSLLLACALPSWNFDLLAVDEAQDLSALQWGLVQHWAADQIVMVGDAMQGIFAYSGADPSIMETTPGEIVELPHNYRSSPELVAAGNALRLDDFRPSAVRDHGPLPELIGHSSLAAMNESIPSDCHVIGRHHFDLAPILSRGLPGVTASTVHAAKGLEYPSVHVLGVSEGIWPDPSQTGGDVDELRVLYTALTRARDSLTIHYVGSPSPLLAPLERLVLND